MDDVREETVINGYAFNPLDEATSFKDENGEGLSIVPILTTEGYQYTMSFEIR